VRSGGLYVNEKFQLHHLGLFLLVLIVFIYDYGTEAHSFGIYNISDYD